MFSGMSWVNVVSHVPEWTAGELGRTFSRCFPVRGADIKLSQPSLYCAAGSIASW